jgi:hypothetical protein
MTSPRSCIFSVLIALGVYPRMQADISDRGLASFHKPSSLPFELLPVVVHTFCIMSQPRILRFLLRTRLQMVVSLGELRENSKVYYDAVFCVTVCCHPVKSVNLRTAAVPYRFNFSFPCAYCPLLLVDIKMFLRKLTLTRWLLSKGLLAHAIQELNIQI